MKRANWTAILSCHSGSYFCCYSYAPSHDGGSWLNLVACDDRMHVAAWELRITSGSPLCRGLTRAIYIERLRILRFSGESNPGPPALQASTLWTEPYERPYLLAIRDLTCVATRDYFFKHRRQSLEWDYQSIVRILLSRPEFCEPAEWAGFCRFETDKNILSRHRQVVIVSNVNDIETKAQTFRYRSLGS
jgi:hypothetical protein